LASSLYVNGRRLIAVGSGFDTKKERSTESAKLLRWGLSKFDLIEIAKANSVVETLDVWLGKKNLVGVYTKEDIYKTIPKARKKHLKVSINYNGPIQAPITKDDVLGKLIVSYKGEMIEEYDLLAFENIKRLNLFSRLIRSVNFLIWGDV
jgi:D-alanyl-D-alanine carboxypeptidase (penicillin-binding protein 5/6)